MYVRAGTVPGFRGWDGLGQGDRAVCGCEENPVPGFRGWDGLGQEDGFRGSDGWALTKSNGGGVQFNVVDGYAFNGDELAGTQIDVRNGVAGG